MITPVLYCAVLYCTVLYCSIVWCSYTVLYGVNIDWCEQLEDLKCYANI